MSWLDLFLPAARPGFRTAAAGRWARWIAPIVLLWAGPPALADIWGYVDERGVTHFAAERVDARYELFFRGNEPGAAVSAAPGGRAGTVPTASPRLLAYFEISPGYKSVQHLLREASSRHDIDYELIQAVIATESGFDAGAVSPRGAVGLMQVMPATAEQFGVTGDERISIAQKLTDPRVNIATGTRFLRHLINRFPGELELALAAYNAGEAAVRRAGNRVPDFRETRNYVRTVMQIYATLRPPAPVVQKRSELRSSAGLIPAAGGALGRGNMIPSTGAPAMPTLPKAAAAAPSSDLH